MVVGVKWLDFHPFGSDETRTVKAIGVDDAARTVGFAKERRETRSRRNGCRCFQRLLGILPALPDLEGTTVKNPVFLIIMCAVLLVAIAGLAISSARLVGLF